MEKGAEVPQILMDIRVQNMLKWKTSVLLFDSYLGDRSTEIIRAISSRTSEGISSQFEPLSLYLHTLNSSGSDIIQNQKIYENILRPYKQIKYNQFLIFSSSIKQILAVAEKLNLLNTFNQWLFFIPPAKEISDINSLTEHIAEGANVAFAFNSTGQSNCNVSYCFHSSLNCLNQIAKKCL